MQRGFGFLGRRIREWWPGRDKGEVLETLEEISDYSRRVQSGSGTTQTVPSLRGLSGVRTPVLAAGTMKPIGKATSVSEDFHLGC